MNIKKSIIARTNTFKSKHYGLTFAGLKLKHLKNIHKGRRCFIIGNGPSLSVSDLNKLLENKEITFGFNRIYYIFDQTRWRPTYYISQDEKMLAGCIDEVSSLECKIKFIPAEIDWYFGLSVDNCLPFHITTEEKNGIHGFSTDISKKIVNADTVVYSAFQIAFYMGIKEMYLLGVDQSFRVTVNNKGELTIDNNAKDYFSDKYNFDKDKLYIPNTEASGRTFMSAKYHSQELDFQIYNATRGGKLDIFPRVDFDALFTV